MDFDLNNIQNLRQNLTMILRLNPLAGYILLVLAINVVPGRGTQIQECRGVDLNFGDEHVNHIKECVKEAAVKDVKDLPPDKLPCFGKCVFGKKGLLDTKGLPHREKIMNLIERMPKEVHVGLNKRMATCLIPNNTAIIDTKDKTCTTYLPVLMCIHITFLEECAKPG